MASSPHFNPSKDLRATTLGQTIAAFGPGQPMQFVLPDKTILQFNSNPIHVDEESNPIEAAFPTRAGWFVQRWMLEPRKWTINGYAGTQGREIEYLLSQLEGQSNVTWLCPYIKNAGGRVRIISVKRPKDNKAPFSIYYSITMQALETTVFDNLGTIIPNRVTSAFVSPSIGVGFGNLNNKAEIPVLAQWKGINDAATYIKQNGLSTLSMDDLIASIKAFNPNVPVEWGNTMFNPERLGLKLSYAKS